MNITITPEPDDTGRTVFAWFVLSTTGEVLAGGYCAMRAEAQAEARDWVNGLLDDIDRCGVVVTPEIEQSARALAATFDNTP